MSTSNEHSHEKQADDNDENSPPRSSTVENWDTLLSDQIVRLVALGASLIRCTDSTVWSSIICTKLTNKDWRITGTRKKDCSTLARSASAIERWVIGYKSAGCTVIRTTDTASIGIECISRKTLSARSCIGACLALNITSSAFSIAARIRIKSSLTSLTCRWRGSLVAHETLR